MSSLPEVSVILPTLALRERASLIRRACASVLEQEGVRSELILVVNGARRDTGLVAELAKDRRTRLASLEAADLPAALRRGRELVETPWFAELDDDDVMLPGALARRVRALQARPDCVAVVQNGIVRRPGGDRRVMEDVDATLFDGMPSSLECTYLAVRLALWGPIRFLDRPGVVWHERLWPSASSARRHLLGHEEALERILETPPLHATLAGLRLEPARRRRRAMKGAPTRVRLRSPEIGLLEGVDRYGRTGEHRPDGMVVLAGPGVSSSTSWIEASVLDFAPSLARSLSVELPEREGRSVAPLC